MIKTVRVLTRSRRSIGSVCQTGLWEFAREVLNMQRENRSGREQQESLAAANIAATPREKQSFHECERLIKPELGTIHITIIPLICNEFNYLSAQVQDARGNNRAASDSFSPGDPFHQCLNAIKYLRWSKQTCSQFSIYVPVWLKQLALQCKVFVGVTHSRQWGW